MSHPTLAELSAALDAGRTDPVTLAEARLDAIASHPHGAAIYARTMPDAALAQARAARDRARAGTRRGPMDGVAISWKDNFDTAGVATEAGTALMAGRVPERDAALVARAAAAGAVALGKTHLSEIAFSGLGLNPVTATPPGWHVAEAVPGGSSSGAAASVAHGLAAAAIGTDTGGSVRIPAAWHDLVGFKTTHGGLPMEGVVPLCEAFDTAGPLTRCVADAATVWAMLADCEAPDLAEADVAQARMGIVTDVVLDDLEAAPAAAFDHARDRLAAAGATLSELSHPGIARAYGLGGPLFTADAWSWWAEAVETRGEVMFPPIRARVEAGAQVSARAYLQGWRELRAIRHAVWDAARDLDALILPTAPLMPPDRARLLADDAYYREANLLTLRNTRLANLLGGCAITVPTGHPCCGLSLVARPGAELGLLRLAAAVERTLA
ncbi:MAG: amidase [Paracoccaceae bacterium]